MGIVIASNSMFKQILPNESHPISSISMEKGYEQNQCSRKHRGLGNHGQPPNDCPRDEEEFSGNESMIVVYPTEGLANKLRVTFSFYQKALETNEELIVIWDVTPIKGSGIYL